VGFGRLLFVFLFLVGWCGASTCCGWWFCLVLSQCVWGFVCLLLCLLFVCLFVSFFFVVFSGVVFFSVLFLFCWLVVFCFFLLWCGQPFWFFVGCLALPFGVGLVVSCFFCLLVLGVGCLVVGSCCLVSVFGGGCLFFYFVVGLCLCVCVCLFCAFFFRGWCVFFSLVCCELLVTVFFVCWFFPLWLFLFLGLWWRFFFCVFLVFFSFSFFLCFLFFFVFFFPWCVLSFFLWSGFCV